MTLSTPSPFPLESSNKNCLSYQTWRKKANGNTGDTNTDDADDADDTDAKKASSILGFFSIQAAAEVSSFAQWCQEKQKKRGMCWGWLRS